MSNLTNNSTNLQTILATVNSLPEASTGTAAVIESLNITANGTYTASGETDGYSPITVSVPTSYKGEYSDSTAYVVGDIVTYNGNVYQCTSDTTAGYNPVDMTIYWNGGTPLNTDTALVAVEEWGRGNAYTEGTIVTYNGVYYICTTTHDGYPASPDNDSERWEKVNGDSSGAVSLVTLSAGTYTLNTQSPYNANYGMHSYRYEISEYFSSGACYYTTDGGTTETTFTHLKLTGVGGGNCPDAPYTYAYFYNGDPSSNSTIGTVDSMTGTNGQCSIIITSDTQVSALFYSVFMGMMQ